MTRPLLVIDGDSFAHRSYHGLPKTIRRRGNKGGGAIVGFANFLLRLYETEHPRAVLVGWDTLDEPTYRHRALESYQAGRDFDTELVDQLGLLPDFVAACGFANAKAAGYEADDFLAAAAKEEKRGRIGLVATGDRDAYQLASESTTILQPIKAGEMARIGPAEARERYGVDPSQVPDFIALRGDASDHILGAKGVGPKGAAALLRKYWCLRIAPPLGPLRRALMRERRADIVVLAQDFLAEITAPESAALSQNAADRLTAYDWPGNVRELRNATERVVTLVRGPVIDAADLDYLGHPEPSLTTGASTARCSMVISTSR
jgi:DNA polymerase-1